MDTPLYNKQLRAQLLTTLGLAAAAPEEQKLALGRLETVARSRLARLIPQLLSQSQLEVAEKMRAAGKEEQAILAWVKRQMPAPYDEMMRALMLDVADEIARLAMP